MSSNTGHHEAPAGEAGPVQAYLDSLGEGSRRTVLQSLDAVAAAVTGMAKSTRHDIAWEEVTRDTLDKAVVELAKAYMPATVNKMLSCVRGVRKQCRDMGLMSSTQYESVAAIPNLPLVHHPDVIRLVAQSEVKALLGVCARQDGASGRRDAALLAILLSSGLRRAEAAALDVTCYRLFGGILHIPPSPSNAVARDLVMLPQASMLIEAWLDVRKGEPGPLLLPVNKGGVIANRQLTDQAIYDIVRKTSARAGIPHITTRSLRRTFVASLIGRNLPLEHVQHLVGHASWVTTNAYTELVDEMNSRDGQLPELMIDVARSLKLQKKGNS